MNITKLNKNRWNNNDFDDYFSYQDSLRGEKFDCNWEKRIVNTQLDCFGKTSFKAKVCAKEIAKGNYLEFINHFIYNNHFDSLVLAYLISKIKDFELYKKYLIMFANKIDNWASCDSLKFNKCNKNELKELINIFFYDKKPFVRRIAIKMLFEFIDKDNVYIIFNYIDLLRNEKEYYVNMCASWLLCECFIKQREETLQYLKSNFSNDFIINKMISKCMDSFRVNKEDKDLLLAFRR